MLPLLPTPPWARGNEGITPCLSRIHRKNFDIDAYDVSRSPRSLERSVGLKKSNVSGGNQPLRANYENFNLSHTMLIKGGLMGGGRGDLQKYICKSSLPPLCTSPLPPSISLFLDQHRVAQIEVFIICTEGLVSLWYVPLKKTLISYCKKDPCRTHIRYFEVISW
jgi:hypothetical protein